MAKPLVVSLGTNCELAFNLRRYYSLERAYPFDWWITPLDVVATVIERQFTLNLVEDNLEVVGEGHSVLNRELGILHHHDFPRDEHGRIVANWRDHVAACRQKYEFLGKRFFQDIGAARRVVAFVNRNGTHAWLTPQRWGVCEHPASYARIVQVLAERFPRLSLQLVVLNPVAPQEDVAQLTMRSGKGSRGAWLRWWRPRVVIHTVKDYGDRFQGLPDHYGNSIRGWDETLERVLRPGRYAHSRR